jgi:hypothetical protein
MTMDTHATKGRDGAGGASPLSDEQLRDLIARRAFALYEMRGCRDGHDTEDWLEAEKRTLADLRSGPERPRVHRERQSRGTSGARSAS